MHLKQRGFTYSACGPFTKNKERIEKFIQNGNTDFIYKNELDKVGFQHNMAYGKSKDLIKRTQSDKVLQDKAFKIASNPNYDGYQSFINFLTKDRKEVVFPLRSQINLLMNQIINWQMNFKY